MNLLKLSRFNFFLKKTTMLKKVFLYKRYCARFGGTYIHAINPKIMDSGARLLGFKSWSAGY